MLCRVSLTHCNPKAFKTDAPFDMVWDMLRAWIKEQPLNQKPEPESKIARILEKVRLSHHAAGVPTGFLGLGNKVQH